MTRSDWVHWTWVLLVLGAGVLACSFLPASGTPPSNTPAPSGPAPGTPVPSSPAAETPTSGTPSSVGPPTATGSLTAEPASRGPGSFDLADPAIGLTGLTSYHATLLMQFTGTDAGQPAQWSRALSLTVSAKPVASLWTQDSTAPSDKAVAAVVGGEIAGVSYSRLAKGDTCAATTLSATDPLPPPQLPASLLPPLLGAETAGAAQTINGLAANHYTFDERGLDLVGTATAKGEAWVAANGGIVVKYLLTAKGSDDYFGQGIQGTMTWDYELKDANQSFAVDPPPGCPPGLIDAPLPPGAQGIEQDPGLTTYTTAASITDVVAYYGSNLPPGGWKAIGTPQATSRQAILSYARGDQQLNVQVDASGVTRVTLSLETAGQATAGGTPTPGSSSSASWAVTVALPSTTSGTRGRY